MTDITSSARGLIRGAVFTLVRESGGQIAQRPVITGEPGWTANEAEPLAGIAAAKHLEWAAAKAVRDHARRAREDDLSWQQIAAALSLKGDPDYGVSAAEQAFQRLAPDLGSGPSFGFTCGACLATVTDYGPAMGHPEDAERGHADGCARMAGTVRAWRAQWDEDGGTGEDNG